MFPKPDVSLESGNLRQECATLLMKSFEQDKLDLTLVCKDGSRVHTSSKLVATISPLLRSFSLEKGTVSLDYDPQQVTSLLNLYTPASWESNRSYMKLDKECAALMVDLGILTEAWLLDSDVEKQRKMIRAEKEKKKHAKEEEEKRKKKAAKDVEDEIRQRLERDAKEKIMVEGEEGGKNAIFREYLLCSCGWMWIMWMLKKKMRIVGIEIKERLTV